ncbi:MAG: tetratricopeptide repeat protein [Gemmataceae bacterium]|nr:tetratricopeptide repeat protein [Gemmataceae bacterium]MDW8243246.1 tetratricopeptide repeat protein [Thermogemmata sp.]
MDGRKANTSGEWDELDKEVEKLLRRGDYARAVGVARKALQVAEQNFGSDHLNVAESLIKLAELHRE